MQYVYTNYKSLYIAMYYLVWIRFTNIHERKKNNRKKQGIIEIRMKMVMRQTKTV